MENHSEEVGVLETFRTGVISEEGCCSVSHYDTGERVPV